MRRATGDEKDGKAGEAAADVCRTVEQQDTEARVEPTESFETGRVNVLAATREPSEPRAQDKLSSTWPGKNSEGALDDEDAVPAEATATGGPAKTASPWHQRQRLGLKSELGAVLAGRQRVRRDDADRLRARRSYADTATCATDRLASKAQRGASRRGLGTCRRWRGRRHRGDRQSDRAEERVRGPALLGCGQTLRIVAATAANADSNRSHSLVLWQHARRGQCLSSPAPQTCVRALYAMNRE